MANTLYVHAQSSYFSLAILNYMSRNNLFQFTLAIAKPCATGMQHQLRKFPISLHWLYIYGYTRQLLHSLFKSLDEKHN